MPSTNLYHDIKLLGQDYYALPADWLEKSPPILTKAITQLTEEHVSEMRQIIMAIETVIALPAYQKKVLCWAPTIAKSHTNAKGVFFGYDFHITPDGPRLIEINTNASGAALALLLTSAQGSAGKKHAALLEQQFFAMFLSEWRQQRGAQSLHRIAIVDDKPAEQYLYSEFLLFQALFRKHGVDAIIVDPAELEIKNGQMYQNNLPIDLIYNRLTDFALSLPQHNHLRQAYVDDLVVVTPNPIAYALYADKRNLCVLSDMALLESWEVDEKIRTILAKGLPSTFLVEASQAEALWRARKTLFFKPVSSYAGKGAYRGRTLTKRVFSQILTADYIAQAMIPPSEQTLVIDGKPTRFKVDVRNYVYDSEVLNLIARVYQGQVTNFRTIGSGFSLCEVV